MKKLIVALVYTMIGDTSIMVPDDLSLKEAIHYAKAHINEIPTPAEGDYLPDSDEIDDDGCRFPTEEEEE